MILQNKDGGTHIPTMQEVSEITGKPISAEPDSGNRELLQACDRPDLYEKLKRPDAPADHVEHVLQKARQLDYLETLIRHCPHVEISYCDDPDVERWTVGFMIRVHGCETIEVYAPTLGEAIDKEKAEAEARSKQ